MEALGIKGEAELQYTDVKATGLSEYSLNM